MPFSRVLLAFLLLVSARAGDPELASFHLEDQVRIISWTDVQNALVAEGLAASDSNEFLIQVDPTAATTDASDYLRRNASDAVVAGTTRLIKTGATPPGTTTSLYWRPRDDDFSIKPGADDVPDYPAITVATVRVFLGAAQIGGDWVLQAHVKGVADDKATYFPLHTAGDTLPITIARGGSTVISYQDFTRNYTSWNDLERDATFCFFVVANPSWTIAFSNGTSWSRTPSGLISVGTPYMTWGDTMTISIPSDQPLGDFTLFQYNLYDDANGDHTLLSGTERQTPPKQLIVRVVDAASGGSNSTSSSGGGGGGCGAGAAGGIILILLGLLALPLRRRRMR